jgi:hypothetical protein
MILTFTHDEISDRYELFVKGFMSGEEGVERT